MLPFTCRAYFQVNRGLVASKVLCVVYYAGCISMLAYLTIHMKWLGLTMAEIGVILAILPFVTLLGAPIFGPIADRKKLHRLLLVVFIVVSTMTHCALLFIPRNALQASVVLQYTGNGHAYLILTAPEGYDCFDGAHVFTANIQNCLQSPTYNGTGCPDYQHYELTLGTVLNSSNGSHTNQLIYRLEGFTVPHDGCVSSANADRSWQCNVTISDQSSPACLLASSSTMQTFFTYSFVRGLAAIAVSVAFVLLDAVMLELIKRYQGDYGMQRFWQGVGMAVGPPITGVFIDLASKSNSPYYPAFVMYAATAAISIVLICIMEVPQDIKAHAIFKNVGALLRYPSIVIFLCAVFFLGFNFGILEGLSFLYFEQLNATGTEMGLTVLVANLASLPIVFLSKPIIQRTGYTAVFIMSFLLYGVRYWGYAIVYQMKYIYPLELIECVTTALCWVAAVSYSYELTPPGMYATMQTLIGALHWGVGKGTGSLVGALWWQAYGARNCYEMLAIVCTATSVLYWVVHICVLRKLPNPRHQSMFDTAANGPKQLELKEMNTHPAIDHQCDDSELGRALSEGTVYFDAFDMDDRQLSRRASLYLSAASLT